MTTPTQAPACPPAARDADLPHIEESAEVLSMAPLTIRR